MVDGAAFRRLMERAHVVNIRRGRSYRTDGPDASRDRPPGLDLEDEPRPEET